MGECVDGAGDVYITDYQAQTIDEYAHGSTKQLRAISDSYKPYGWQSTQDRRLAVANFGETYEAGLRSAYVGEGNLAIYVHAKGQPIYYGTRFQHFSACAYDKYGDLLAASIDGYSGDYSGEFDYMPAKSKNFAEIALPGPESSWYWGESPAVGWDGKYWLVDTYGLYRYSINIKAQYVDTVSLSVKEPSGGCGLPQTCTSPRRKSSGPATIFRQWIRHLLEVPGGRQSHLSNVERPLRALRRRSEFEIVNKAPFLLIVLLCACSAGGGSFGTPEQLHGVSHIVDLTCSQKQRPALIRLGRCNCRGLHLSSSTLKVVGTVTGLTQPQASVRTIKATFG